MKNLTVIFGAGVAGLWLLDELVRAGRPALLLETKALGAGQTVAAQGIVHGGLKYTLQGLLTPAASAIREMPQHWRDCLEGRRAPNLRGTRIRADHCYLWRTDSLSSRLGMLGAKFGLRVAPQAISENERPGALAQCPGSVARLDEPVISTPDLLASLAAPHRDRLLKIDARRGLTFNLEGPGRVKSIVLTDPESGRRLEFEPDTVVFTAGAGNAELRKMAGLSSSVMQLRPLHMVLVRGDLPTLNGHCVDGAKTRVTITTDCDSQGRTVWQVGGQLSEDGVALDAQRLIARAQDELLAVIPGLSLTGTEWATYRVDRAEGATASGVRPDSVQIVCDGNVITAWPTKMVLAPRLASDIAALLVGRGAAADRSRRDEDSSPHAASLDIPENWPRPQVALPPWDTSENWIDFETSRRDLGDAA